MKIKFYSIVSLFLLAFQIPVAVDAQVNKKPFVIPEIRQWKGAVGSFTPKPGSAIKLLSEDSKLKEIAAQFSSEYYQMFGVKLPVIMGAPGKGDFVLSISPVSNQNKEAYLLKIEDWVTLSANHSLGILWGTKTILQISEQNLARVMPKGTILDFPSYPVRGFVLDCGRKFIPLHYLKEYVRMMSYYKMNAFQIHLNDNGFAKFFDNDWNKTYAAFRLESATYPGLAAPDGYYTKKEFILLQKFADSLGVEIIPEIDVPAHSLAFSKYKPEIGSKEYGMDHLDLFNPETYRFTDNLFKEYLEGPEPVFIGPRVHIGTDEYSNKDQKVVEKFRYFTDRYIRLAESYGKQAMVWGALTHAKGETPVKSDNVWMNAWYNGYADPGEMMKAGYDLISIPDEEVYIVPAAGYYKDFLDIKALYNSWTPAHIGKQQFSENHPQIKGGMFAVWNDHVGNGISVKDIHYRVKPAMQTLSVKMWSDTKPDYSFSDFDKLRQNVSEAPGLNLYGWYGNAPRQILHLKRLQPHYNTGINEIGFNYTVSFLIKPVREQKGTVLFQSRDAVFYLSDPVSGKLGFSRDGYLNTFDYMLPANQTVEIKIQGNTQNTSLYINSSLKETLNKKKMYFNQNKDSMYYVQTLVFPLQTSGDFKSSISNLKVYNNQ